MADENSVEDKSDVKQRMLDDFMREDNLNSFKAAVRQALDEMLLQNYMMNKEITDQMMRQMKESSR